MNPNRPDEDDEEEERTPTDSGREAVPPPRSSHPFYATTPMRPDAPAASPSRPWQLDNARERGTDPYVTLQRLKEEAKAEERERQKRAARKPWYAAGLTAIMLAVAGAITYSVHAAFTTQEVAVQTSSRHGEIEAKMVSEQAARLEGEKALHEDNARLEAMLKEISQKLDKKR